MNELNAPTQSLRDTRTWSVITFPTAEEYIRAECDEIFGHENARQTILQTGDSDPTHLQLFTRWKSSGDFDRFRETHRIAGA